MHVPSVQLKFSFTNMTSQLVQRVAKSPDKLTHVSLNQITVAVDDSGSTSGKTFADEISFVARPILQNHLPIILWGSHARHFQSIHHLSFSGGGTDPSSIFIDQHCSSMVQGLPIFCLVTDGEIDSSAVEKLSRVGGPILQTRALNIGVFFNCRSVSRIDISVMAPLLFAGPNCLIFGFDGQVLRLLLVHGDQLKPQVPVQPQITDDTKWSDMPVVTQLGTFLESLKIETQSVILPPESLKMSETGEMVEFVTFNDLLSALSKENFETCFAELQTLKWDFILENARATGRLGRIRSLTEELNTTIGQITQRPDPRLAELFELGNAVATRVADQTSVQKYRDLLKNIVNDERKSRAEYLEQTRPQRQFIQQLLAELHRVSSASWNISEHGSNRSKRAQHVIPLTVHSFNDILVRPDMKFLEVECKICFETKPTALLFIPGPSDQFYLEDFAIDCPLACGYQASQKFCNVHVCIDCATFFVQQGRDIYHRPVLGMWPVALDIPRGQVWDYYSIVTKQAFLGGKDLSHSMMLMFAAVESLGSHAWSNTPEWLLIRKTVLGVLLQNIQTTTTFDATSSTYVPLLEAMKNITTPVHYSDFNVKPISMQFLIIRIGLEHNFILDSQVLVAAAATSHLVSMVKGLDKIGLELFKQEVLSRSYQHMIHGVPVRSTMVCLPVDEFKSVKLGALIPLVKPSLDPLLWTTIVHRVLDLALHQHIFESLKKQQLLLKIGEYAELGYILEHSGIPKCDLAVLDSIWTGVVRVIKDNNHLSVPPYYLNLGSDSCTDPLACGSCGVSFLPGKGDYLFDALVRHVLDSRRNHFTHFYGSEIPNETSVHCLLHRTAAQVLSSQPPDESAEVDLVFQALISNHKRGDIHHADIFNDTAKVVESFRKIQQQEDFSLGIGSCRARSNKFKVLCALYKRNVLTIHPRELVSVENFTITL